VNWRLMVRKTRVKKKCFQFSSEGGGQCMYVCMYAVYETA